jgi:hypothetical protein
MELTVTFTVRCDAVSMHRKRCAMTADEAYIRRLSETLKQRSDAEAEQTRKANREAAIVKEQAPKFWMELKAWLRDSVNAVKQASSSAFLKYSDVNVNEVSVQYQTDDALILVFSDGATSKITVGDNLMQHDAEYTFAVIGGIVVCVSNGQPLTVDEVGKRILDAAAKV